MTIREFMEQVIAGTENVELKEYATEYIAKLDEKNAKRKARPSKASIENAEILEKEILPILTEEPQTAKELSEQLENRTIAKVTAVLRLGESQGVVAKHEFKKNDPYKYSLVG